MDATLMVTKELAVRTSAMVTPDGFRDAVGLLATGKARAEPLITGRRPLDQIGDAFETTLDRDAAVKLLITPAP